MKHWALAFLSTLPFSMAVLYFMGPASTSFVLAGAFFFFAASVIRKISSDDQFDRKTLLDLPNGNDGAENDKGKA